MRDLIKACCPQCSVEVYVHGAPVDGDEYAGTIEADHAPCVAAGRPVQCWDCNACDDGWVEDDGPCMECAGTGWVVGQVLEGPALPSDVNHPHNAQDWAA